ncbi:hypothetical protein TrST_g6498 [Triparma strigata]|uniref:Nucleoporin Nup54 alpha-helical domain-containing protein n=1 Tax=Triparma strigata TaxID=1606541 RepID=A0A9W7AUE6_9STRA|nr:hypothetical protein TrST_g6498 [Triparma strigata]
MAFSFSSPTPAAPSSGFGGFGSTTPSAPAPAPAAGGFGGFGTPAPAPAPAAGGFGGFGAPAPAPAPAAGGFGGFGQQAPAPAPSAFGSFGAAAPAPAPSAFGGFGAAAPAPAPGAFGATATSGFGGFGSPAAAPAPSAFGAFGVAAPAPAPSAFGSFGAAAPAPASAFGSSFGQPQQQPQQHPQQSQLPPHVQAQNRERQLATEKLSQTLKEITAAYNSNDPSCRFQYLFYNKVDPSHRHLYTCPSNVSPKAWEEAEMLNPDPENLVPAPCTGVSSLQKRVVNQQLEVKRLSSFVTKLKEASAALQSRTSRSSSTVVNFKMQQEILAQRLLQAMRKVEVLRCMGLSIQPDEMTFRNEIMSLHKNLDRPQSLLQEITASASTYKQMRASSLSPSLLASEDLKALYKILVEQQTGINHLTEVVKKDRKDMELIRGVEGEEKRVRG